MADKSYRNRNAGHPSRLSVLRAEAGFSQRALARTADVSRDTIARIEAGRGLPTVRSAQKLATALGTTVDEVFQP